MLHHETGASDIVVTCLFANRNQVEIESLIGNFYAGLPLRTRLAGARTFRELLARVRDVTLAAHEHPDILDEPVLEGMGLQDKEDRAAPDLPDPVPARQAAGRRAGLSGLKADPPAGRVGRRSART